MGEKFAPVKKENVVDQIIKAITDSIVAGKYKAGMKLPNEYELIQEFHVSRNSLREAMKILSAMGIVEIRRGDGTYVCSEVKPSLFDNAVFGIVYGMSTDAELLELRQIIDEEIVRLAMEKITPQEIRALYENIEQMEETLKDGQYEQAEKLDFSFHQMLINACQNRFFIRIMQGVYSIFEKSIINTMEYEKEMTRCAYHHRKIMECIEKKDQGSIARVIADSLSTWKK